jgi:hypothetical protein
MRYEIPEITSRNLAQKSVQHTDKPAGTCFDGGNGSSNTSASAYEVDE